MSIGVSIDCPIRIQEYEFSEPERVEAAGIVIRKIFLDHNLNIYLDHYLKDEQEQPLSSEVQSLIGKRRLIQGCINTSTAVANFEGKPETEKDWEGPAKEKIHFMKNNNLGTCNPYYESYNILKCISMCESRIFRKIKWEKVPKCLSRQVLKTPIQLQDRTRDQYLGKTQERDKREEEVTCKGVLELEASHHIFARYQTSPKFLHKSLKSIFGLIFLVCFSNSPMNKINTSAFRDPTTAWLGLDKMWRVLIGSTVNKLGLVILYKSKDLHSTLARKPLHPAEGTGTWKLDTSARGKKVKYVLRNNLDETYKHDYYTVGTYDAVKNKYFPDKGMIEGDSGLRYDYGKFYASKTFFDSEKHRRILRGWAGVQDGWLDKCGKQLLQWPIKEIEKLRGNQVKWPSKILEGGSKLEVTGVTAGQLSADIVVEFEVSHELKKVEVLKEKQYNPQFLCSQKSASVRGDLGPFGFLTFASNTLSEYTSIFFRIYKHNNKHKVLMCSDQSRSSLNKYNDNTTYGAFVDLDPAREQLSLRCLIDRSIVESFGGGGKAVITSRVYPTQAIDNQIKLFVFNNGTSSVKITFLNAWSMNKAHIS
ncbi:hypothetical protein ACOSQ3_003935 [Xanthoceras sorbifolium]